MLHCWLVPPLQVHRSSWVPLAVLELGSSRHLPELALTHEPFGPAVQFSPAVPAEHGSSTIRVLFAVPFPVASACATNRGRARRPGRGPCGGHDHQHDHHQEGDVRMARDTSVLVGRDGEQAALADAPFCVSHWP